MDPVVLECATANYRVINSKFQDTCLTAAAADAAVKVAKCDPKNGLQSFAASAGQLKSSNGMCVSKQMKMVKCEEVLAALSVKNQTPWSKHILLSTATDMCMNAVSKVALNMLKCDPKVLTQGWVFAPIV